MPKDDLVREILQALKIPLSSQNNVDRGEGLLAQTMGRSSAATWQASTDALLNSLLGQKPNDASSSNDTVSDEPTPSRELSEQIRLLTREVTSLSEVSRLSADTLESNTRAVIENSLVQAGKGGKGESIWRSKIAGGLLGSAGGIATLTSLLGKLFGGGPEPTSYVPRPFALPAPVRISGGLSQDSEAEAFPLVYGQDGLPRGISTQHNAPGPQITIQVQAMDSKSFMDHSEAIARAVRQAMLNSHSLNDVMAEF